MKTLALEQMFTTTEIAQLKKGMIGLILEQFARDLEDTNIMIDDDDFQDIVKDVISEIKDDMKKKYKSKLESKFEEAFNKIQ